MKKTLIAASIALGIGGIALSVSNVVTGHPQANACSTPSDC